jgi:predicted XRE-type DNA-binding protein
MRREFSGARPAVWGASAQSDMTQAAVAKLLGLAQARVSDIKRGSISRFSLDLFVRLAARAGLRSKLKLAA